MVIKFLKYRVKIETGFILPRRTQVKGCKENNRMSVGERQRDGIEREKLRKWKISRKTDLFIAFTYGMFPCP